MTGQFSPVGAAPVVVVNLHGPTPAGDDPLPRTCHACGAPLDDPDVDPLRCRRCADAGNVPLTLPIPEGTPDHADHP